VLHMEFH